MGDDFAFRSDTQSLQICGLTSSGIFGTGIDLIEVGQAFAERVLLVVAFLVVLDGS